MIVRIILILVCISFFINSCNSLVSQFFGTHKLRTLPITQAQQEGVGDADYLELEDVSLSGDFAFQASAYPNSPGIILYPVLTPEQAEQRAQGQDVTLHFVAWTADFHSPCVDEGNCISAGTQNLRGVVREIPEDRLPGLDKLRAQGYVIKERVVTINQGEAPIAWYWNALAMLGAAAFAVGMEAYYNRKNETATQDAEL